MFRGSSFHSLDEKGRIIIPTRFRNFIRDNGGILMISQLDGCLVAYTMGEWNKIEARLMDLAEKSTNMRRFRRIFIGEAAECTCDRQGRVLVPPTLRQYAELVKDIVLAGVLDHFEVWSREKWDEEKMLLKEDMKEEDFSNEIAKLGL
jgi:transcriptional regulator MraZ